jgi:dihydrofolate reductase
LIVISMILPDGVMQGPGGSNKDTSDGFEYGGWAAPFGDEAYGKLQQEQMKPGDLLLGRKTFGNRTGRPKLMPDRALMK